MKTTDKNTSWNQDLLDHATNLEMQATVARFVALAETRRDALAATWDLAMMAVHAKAAKAATARGNAPPAAPAPVSHLLTKFADAMRERILAIGAELRTAEVQRLAVIAPRVLASIEQQDKTVIDLIAGILQLSPGWAAMWISAHLDAIETRFAS
jgi:hypothetical protein